MTENEERPNEPGLHFWGGLGVAIGLLFMATGGLCALASIVSTIVSFYTISSIKPQNGAAIGPDMGMVLSMTGGMIVMLAIAAGIVWVGVVIFRGGLAEIRRKGRE